MLRTIFICTSMLLFGNAFAQQDVLQKIVTGYENPYPLAEEVFVHTDKSFYVCGEILWFKFYVLNAKSHHLQDISRTGYVELINADGKPVLQGKVRIDSGMGNGSFNLPSTLESGNLTLRAYTNWMKNDPSSFFEKSITVINTRKTLDSTKLLSSSISVPSLNKANSENKYDVVVNENERPSIRVKLNGASDAYLFLVARKGNQVNYSAWAPVQNGEALFELNPSILKPGVAEIDIVNDRQQQVYQTYYYNKESASESFHVSTDQPSYHTRNEVTLQLNGTANQFYHLSASVYLLSDLNQPGKDISFPVYIQGFPSRQFTSVSSTGFLNTFSSGNKTIKTGSLNEVQFLPEMNGTLVTVSAKNTNTSQPAADVPVYLSVEGKLANVQVGRTNKNGLAYFNLKNLYGASQLVLQTDPEYQEGLDLSISKSYFPVTSSQQQITASASINEGMESSLETLSNSTIVNDTYSGNKMDSFAITNRDSLPFFGKPYKTYMLDNYKRFVTMEEVLREYVQEVNVRIRNKDYHFQTFNRQFFDLGKYLSIEYMMTDGSPLVLLDGVPVFDNNKIIKYNPLLVRKLDILADKFHVGPKVWNGVMSFTTYKGTLEDFQLNPKDIVVDFDGWQRPRYFYTRDYSHLEIKNSRVPDFRNVLYWNPGINMKSSSKLQFYTGDLTGKFVVVIQGISDEGVPVYATSTFEVVR